jgi:DNA polymerase-3 subunit epsilon
MTTPDIDALSATVAATSGLADATNGTETIAVIDFETTGMTPSQGARGTEIAAVLLRGGVVVGRYQSLMRSGVVVPPFIERLTGISNAMLRKAPPAEEVMREVATFTRGCAMVAHNAAFDRGFWLAELARAGCEPDPAHRFACTVLLSRRLLPDAPNHRLGTLASWLAIDNQGRAHRALADALTTAQLLRHLQQTVARRYAVELAGQAVSHALLAELQIAAKTALARCVARHAGRLASTGPVDKAEDKLG